ncbi:Dephospho-CoA kinase [bioreactor metagenome]|uniref:Dephospho-CoA kinase n=1 Tax=bioreactor metagenome TaxID=1076179 RepID=A0A644UR52_9ZZZZ|nr:dephospho-CoA kinase [Negativicutes bacterium]
MYVIALTGGIASGKSTVSAILRQLGAYIIDTDQIAHDITKPNQPAWMEIADRFGREFLLSDGHIDRKRLGETVFKYDDMRKLLEEITHPKIKEQVCREIDHAARQGFTIVVIDVPLLIEVGWQKMADEIWVVYVDEPTQLYRLMDRNQWTRQEALARIAAQMSLADKVSHANVVINNNSSLEVTRSQVIEAWHQATKGRSISSEEIFLE